jgi:succinate dehydrogenase / fumarate reductase cytochrome b subunit
MSQQQPVYLNLFKIKLPITGIVSLMHRVTGVLLFLAIPFSIYLLSLSLGDSQGFITAEALWNHPLVILFEIAVFGALMYHLFAGIRFLLMDINWGSDLKTAIHSSWMVVGATAVATLIFIVGRIF